MPRCKRRGEMFHIDTGGGGQTLGDPEDFTPSFSGSRYFVLMTCDATRRRWIYFIQFKSDIYISMMSLSTFSTILRTVE